MENYEYLNEAMLRLTLTSFKKEELRKLGRHLQNVINHPKTQENAAISRYLNNLEDTHKKIYKQKRDGVSVEYIFPAETKNNLQRQRFNSLPVSEVPELLKTEFPTSENAEQVHICTDCVVEIELNDEEPLMELLQKHFNLEVHMPKLKRESVDVAEPILLPNMSRRLSAMECGDQAIDVSQFRQAERIDRGLLAKLETSLMRVLPDNSESNIDNAVKFYQSTFDKLCLEVAQVDFAALTGTVAPIIMSIKDNVNQHFASESKGYENEENDQPSSKNLVKKPRFYGPIENIIVSFLLNHKLLSLTDDRTGKPAFFCIACEYYTLRFCYDSVLNHVFSDSHIHNLSCILQSDVYVPYAMDERTVDKINEMNRKFLLTHSLSGDASLRCGLCKVNVELEGAVIHMLDESHLAKFSDKLYKEERNRNQSIPTEWGPKSTDWAKFLAVTGKPLTAKDHVVIENFIKPAGKVSNHCLSCDTVLKGPRQILFTHIRQKKHLRNAAPLKLSVIYKNYSRAAEYYAGFGNFYICSICPEYSAFPTFAAMYEHYESDLHVESLAKYIKTAVTGEVDEYLMKSQTIVDRYCKLCDVTFEDTSEMITHVLSDVKHQNSVVETYCEERKGDLISVYIKGNYILHSEGSTFDCVVCKNIFTSIRSLLMHLVYSEHISAKPDSENIFRFYLVLKHNTSLLTKNRYIYYDFGRLRCGVCGVDLSPNENAKKHLANALHRENMGTSYIPDVSAE